MAEGIVSIVVGRLSDLLSEEAQLLDGVRDEILQVVSELLRINTFLPEADSRISEYRIRLLLADVRELAYDSEHVVESFLLKALSNKTKRIKQDIKYSLKIKNLATKLALLSNCFDDYNISSTLESLISSNSSCGAPGKLKRFYSFPTIEPEIFVGFNGDVDRLAAHLINETWVSILRKWETKDVLRRILICLDSEKRDEILTYDVGELVENLRQIQERLKCLIVLDDLWSADAWDSLKAAFPAEKSVSKLMITSRRVDVVKHVDPTGLVHQPELLTAEQSWELLHLKALPKSDYLDFIRDVKRMEQLGREMVGNCAGLPLAIVILGGILVTKPSLIEWEKVYNDSLSSLKKGKGFGEDYQREVLDILVWSYNDLPPQLKPCFLYLGKNGENEWIEAENLYQLWIAEGMVLSSDRREGETMMQVAESYMGELVHKSMVQVRFNYTESSLIKFESCSLHDLIRTLSITQAKVEDFFEVIDLRERNELGLHTSVDSRFAYSRQLVVHFDEGYTSKQAKHFVKKANQQRYRSVLLFNDFAVRSLPQELGSDLANFRYLRVFALEKVHFDPQTSLCSSLFRIDLARVVGNLVYLRYLSVRGTNLFPWIQNLMLLQTLKLDVQDHIHIPPWLSRNILGKLGHLRHLYLPVKLDHSLRENLKLRLDSLSKLETLENFNTNWCEVKDLPKLICLRKLSLQVGYGFVDLEEMMKYLAALASSSCLQYLGLSIVIEDLGLQNCPDILRQLLGDHNFNLKKLSIIGRLPELAKLFEQQRQQLTTPISVSLICITRLSLSLSRLEEDPMPVLESIPSLCELFLFIKAFVGKEMVCSAPGFLKLTRLVLRGLPHLVKWRIEEGSMRSLSRLKIRECPKLEELPEGLVFLDSLRVLVIEAMPSEFSNRVRVVNGKQGTDFYKVAHVPRLILDNHLISHRS